MPPQTQSPAETRAHGSADAHRAALEALIRETIDAAGGPLPFDRFMELALYAPGLGYYVAGAHKLGAEGDFVTAPEISPLFARCLAAPCREVLAATDAGAVLELGAGTGALAAELLTALAERGPLPERYLILEPSPELAERQRRTLGERVPTLLDRCEWLVELPQGLRGVVIANEVIDAMPVHRFRTGTSAESGARQVEEVMVEHLGDGFGETIRSPASAELTAAVEALWDEGLALAPGYCSEVNLRLRPWVRALAESVAAGLVLAIDYGYPRAELYHPERNQGTLMCHNRHRAHSDPYQDIGLQDITAHVDFSALAAAALSAGFELAGYTTQANFLIGCGIDALMAEAAGDDPIAMLELSAGAKQLLLPSHMGERFQVMGLSRGLARDRVISGFGVRDLRDRLGLADAGQRP